MTDVIAGPRGLDIGRAIGDAGRLAGGRWPLMLGLALGVGWGPQALLIASYGEVARWAGSAANGAVASFGFTLLVLFLALLMRTSVTAAALAPDREVSFGGALAAAFEAVPALAPFWLVSAIPELVRTLVTRYGNLHFAQKGLLVAIAAWPVGLGIAALFGVVSAVAVAERRGFAPTAARSFRLMSVGRWGFVGLYLIFQLAAGLCAYGVAVAFAILRPLSMHDRLADALLRSVSTEFTTDLLQAFWAVVAAMCYRQFRRQLDGPAPGEAADIFA